MQVVKAQRDRGISNERSEAHAYELEQVLEQTGEAIIVKDLNAIVTHWNREAALLYGFSAQEAVGQPLRKLHAAELSDADYARLLDRVRAGRSTSACTERRKKNGEIVRVALKTSPLLDAQGKLVGEITVARDVTALHRTEDALRAAQATLQARLATIRGANRDLTREIAARRKADAATRRNNRALATTVRQLESFHRDREVLSGMAELLQSARSAARPSRSCGKPARSCFRIRRDLFSFTERRAMCSRMPHPGAAARRPTRRWCRTIAGRCG